MDTDKMVEAVADALFAVDRDIEPGTRGTYVRRAQAAIEAMRANLILPTIRVIEKGDFDGQMTLRVVGPFDTEAERDAELARLKKLPSMLDGAWLESSTIPPSAAEQAISPEVSARVRHCNELFEELSNS